MYKVIENMQIMKIETPLEKCEIEICVGMAKQGTELGFYESIENILELEKPQQKQLTSDDLTIQNHAMLTYLMYGDQPNTPV